MSRIFVTGKLPVDPSTLAPRGVEVIVFDQARALSAGELVERAEGADALLTLLPDRVDAALLEALPRVRVVANYAVGYDNLDLEACTARGVWATNTPDVLTEATADLAWALLLSVARRVREGERLVREGGFVGWSPTMLLGQELYGRTIGIFGAGRIGQAVARRAEGFGMNVLRHSRRAGVSREELFARADVLSLHCPLTPETRHAIDAAAFAQMKPSAILINTARGPVVDEEALVRALERGQIAGAGLDVYEEEPKVHPGLLGRDDVVLLPHLGSATHHTRRRMVEIAMDNILAALRGARPPNALNELT